MRYNPGTRYLDLVRESASNQLLSFSPHALTALIHSFGRLGYYPGEVSSLKRY